MLYRTARGDYISPMAVLDIARMGNPVLARRAAEVPDATAEDVRRLVSDKNRPLYHRAVAGTYPPGSTFKPVVGIASLENRRSSTGTTFDCPGYFDLGTARFRCWRKRRSKSRCWDRRSTRGCNRCPLGRSRYIRLRLR